MKNIALTGGGTAGHIMPCVALIPNLTEYFDNIIYVAGSGMETKIIPRYGIPLYQTTVVKLDRMDVLSNVKLPVKLIKGIHEAKAILKRSGVGIVFSKGGYASLPTVFAAKELGIPIIAHESDYSMGLANKLESKIVTRMLTSFPETNGGEYVGNPIRREIFAGDKKRAEVNLQLKANGKKYLMIFGGSSGAEFINKLVEKSKDILSDWNIIHITGENPTSIEERGYTQIKYSDSIGDIFALADAIVMRGGANSLAEVTALGIPCVTIPLPKGTSRGDQVENAKSYAKRGLVTMLEQENVNKETFLGALKYLKTLEKKPNRVETPNDKIARIIIDEYEKRMT